MDLFIIYLFICHSEQVWQILWNHYNNPPNTEMEGWLRTCGLYSLEWASPAYYITYDLNVHLKYNYSYVIYNIAIIEKLMVDG